MHSKICKNLLEKATHRSIKKVSQLTKKKTREIQKALKLPKKIRRKKRITLKLKVNKRTVRNVLKEKYDKEKRKRERMFSFLLLK